MFNNKSLKNGEIVTTAHLNQLVGINDLTAVRDLLDHSDLLSPQE